MLGDKIGDFEAQIIGTKVLSTDPLRVEVTAQGTATLLGTETTEIVTYWSEMRPDGSLYGEGEGVNMTSDGQVATFKAAGIGHPTGEGMGARFRGAVYYHTTSEKLADLNRVACVYEYEVDAEGRARAELFEWK